MKKNILLVMIFLFFWSIMPICFAATTTTTAPPIPDNMKQYIADSIGLDYKLEGTAYDPAISTSPQSFTITILNYSSSENGKGYIIRISKIFSINYQITKIPWSSYIGWTTSAVEIDEPLQIKAGVTLITEVPSAEGTNRVSADYWATFTAILTDHRESDFGLIFDSEASTLQVKFSPENGEGQIQEFNGLLTVNTYALLLVTEDFTLTTDFNGEINYLAWFGYGAIVIVGIVLIYFLVYRKKSKIR